MEHHREPYLEMEIPPSTELRSMHNLKLFNIKAFKSLKKIVSSTHNSTVVVYNLLFCKYECQKLTKYQYKTNKIGRNFYETERDDLQSTS